MRHLLLALACLLLAAPAHAAPVWTVQVDPLTTALGFAHVQVERAVARRWSVYAGPHLRLYDSPLTGEKLDLTGYGVEVGVRRFLTGRAPAGAWLLARGVLARIRSDRAPHETRVGGYESVLVGYTAILRGRWVLAAGGGVQWLDYRVAGRGPRGVFPAAHTALGVAF